MPDPKKGTLLESGIRRPETFVLTTPRTNKLIADELEPRHKFNSITKYLHSFRYRKVINYLQQVAADNPNKKLTVMDIGCGHGQLYAVLKSKIELRYVGVELSIDKANLARERYPSDPDVTIINDSAAKESVYREQEIDVVCALETLEHIPERDVVRIIENVAALESLKLFICSVPIEIGPSIWIKNVGSALMRYKRYKYYTWRQTFWAGLYRLDKLPRHETKHIGFDWRWLAQTIRHNLTIMSVHKFPFDIIPSFLAPSIMFVARRDSEADFNQSGSE